MVEEFRWPDDQFADIRDKLTPREVVEALYAPDSLQLDNRTPAAAPTFLAVCAPTDELRLIVVVCTRGQPSGPWTIVGAREVGANERMMWRKHTS